MIRILYKEINTCIFLIIIYQIIQFWYGITSSHSRESRFCIKNPSRLNCGSLVKLSHCAALFIALCGTVIALCDIVHRTVCGVVHCHFCIVHRIVVVMFTIVHCYCFGIVPSIFQHCSSLLCVVLFITTIWTTPHSLVNFFTCICF